MVGEAFFQSNVATPLSDDRPAVALKSAENLLVVERGGLSSNYELADLGAVLAGQIVIRRFEIELDRFAYVFHRLVDRFALTDTTGERGHMHCIPTLVAWLQYDLQLQYPPPLTHFSIVGPRWRWGVGPSWQSAGRLGEKSSLS